MYETQLQSLSQEDPLEESMPTHSSILTWRIPCSEEPGGLQSVGLQRVRHDSSDSTGTHAYSISCKSSLPSLNKSTPMICHQACFENLDSKHSFFLNDKPVLKKKKKVFIECVTILFLFYILAFWLQGMWDLSSLTRDRTHTSCIWRWSLNTGPPRKSLHPSFLRYQLFTSSNCSALIAFFKYSVLIFAVKHWVRRPSLVAQQ